MTVWLVTPDVARAKSGPVAPPVLVPDAVPRVREFGAEELAAKFVSPL